MRKIEKKLNEAIVNMKPFSGGNTVFHQTMFGKWELVLHGNTIAVFDPGSRHYPTPKSISFAGWLSKTTCSRLNSLPGVSVRIKNGKPYLNGFEINSDEMWSPNSEPLDF